MTKSCPRGKAAAKRKDWGPKKMKTGGHTDNVDNIGPQSVYKKPTINKMPTIRPGDRKYYGKLLDV